MTAQAIPEAQSVVGVQLLAISVIQDGGAQMRVGMNEETVVDYAEEMVSGAEFPPVIVYHDGTAYWLADGYHRVDAARRIGRPDIQAEVHDGDQRDAVLHGIGANARHGLRRTQADKRQAVETLLRDEQWSKWSDRRIAKKANVDHKTVGKIRHEILGGEIPTERTVLFEDRHGNHSEMRVRTTEPKQQASVLQTFLEKVNDEDLVAECQRRGLSVGASHD